MQELKMFKGMVVWNWEGILQRRQMSKANDPAMETNQETKLVMKGISSSSLDFKFSLRKLSLKSNFWLRF